VTLDRLLDVDLIAAVIAQGIKHLHRDQVGETVRGTYAADTNDAGALDPTCRYFKVMSFAVTHISHPNFDPCGCNDPLEVLAPG
jgi:hypothetical protein